MQHGIQRKLQWEWDIARLRVWRRGAIGILQGLTYDALLGGRGVAEVAAHSQGYRGPAPLLLVLRFYDDFVQVGHSTIPTAW